MQSTKLTIVEHIEINPPKPTQELEPQRKPYLCRHIFVDGHQCGSRALRGQPFCYYHYAHRTPVLANRRRRHTGEGFELERLDSLDNHTAIQLSLAEVLGRIAANTIDPKRAWLLLYGLQIAGNNLRHARPNPEAPVPETFVENPTLGQLAPLEEGRAEIPSLSEHMIRLLEADPDADLLKITEGSPQELLNDSSVVTPEVQT
jgi:hypothetical protein